jgi:argininosuccinate lyase
MTRLWDKGQPLDALIHGFTVGDDPQWDLHLVRWDCVGSAAHAHVLHAAGLLTAAERDALCGGLAEIARLAVRGEFSISREEEDCHTAIERWLTARLGDAGRKIHAGRSRNDQVATAMRLFLRHECLRLAGALCDFADGALQRLERDGHLAMPGYTHMQRAMPSSVGQWLHALVEASFELARAAIGALHLCDCCPLGTGAGFGVPLPLDRGLAGRLMGFARVQRSPVDVQNSRGRFETYFARAAADVGAMLERMASDLTLWTSAEFGFVRLPESFTTGSSIMPQKRNPDVAELLRARGARMRANIAELDWVRGKLPSNYHRDLQLTKAPAIRAALEAQELLAVGSAVIAALEFDQQRLAAAMSSDLHATAAAYALVRQGVPFRDAYKKVAAELAAGRQFAPTDGDMDPTRVTPALLAELHSDLASIRAEIAPLAQRVQSAADALLK